MAKKLKTYQTSLGFFDLAIAAPSMKAALEAWGADSNLFHQGAATERGSGRRGGDAKQLKISMPTVSTWSGRFEAHGLDGLNDKVGRGRKPSIPQKKIERVVTEVTRPPKNRKRWSVRSMSRHAGVSRSTVQRIWWARH